jgi:hypothetical protein
MLPLILIFVDFALGTLRDFQEHCEAIKKRILIHNDTARHTIPEKKI